MRRPVILITGANGEVGHGLISRLADQGHEDILALDLQAMEPALAEKCRETFVGDILDRHLIERIVSQYEVCEIYHLAALLSTRAEFTPETAHQVNVGGTLGLLQLALEQSSWGEQTVKFIFPSSIAVYGLPSLEEKSRAGKIKEHEWTTPTTMYGCNKLYCENLGRYFAGYYRQLAVDRDKRSIDFRSLRFPGLVSAETIPHGGTSDYGPEMLHSAAQGKPYACFVRENTTIPFMAMSDAIDAVIRLASADRADLTQTVFNIGAFSASAGTFRKEVLKHFPQAKITFEPDLKRQSIVDTWPEDVNDSAARKQWGWAPRYNLESAFEEVLVPGIAKTYGI